MPNYIKITDFSAPELDVFVRLTGAQLRNKLEPEKGIFIAESPTVIEVALSAGCEPIALLTDERLLGGAVAKIIEKCTASNRCPCCSMEPPLAALNKLTGGAFMECENCHRVIFKN